MPLYPFGPSVLAYLSVRCQTAGLFSLASARPALLGVECTAFGVTPPESSLPYAVAHSQNYSRYSVARSSIPLHLLVSRQSMLRNVYDV